MRRSIVITDLTRMQGERVCVAGYLVDGEDANSCVRPEFRYGTLTEPWLSVRGSVVVRPFAVVELDLLEHRPHPPHTEDWIVDDRYRARVGMLGVDEQQAFLASLDDGAVASIFGAAVHEDHGWYVAAGEGTRSLGTVRSTRVLGVVYAPKPQYGKWDYRIVFEDESGRRYTLSVTDLAFRYYLDHQRDRQGVPPGPAAQRLAAALRGAERLYLRVGLARGYGERSERCHLQVNGVFSFPDYLDGRCFADLSPDRGRQYDLDDVPF
jgi:hypothetical protein